jgi:hypothetical protein
MGRQIREYVKPNTLKRSRLRHVEVSNIDETTWTKIEDNKEVENHLIARNLEQFSHAGATPFGYTDIGKELGQHIGTRVFATHYTVSTIQASYGKDAVSNTT